MIRTASAAPVAAMREIQLRGRKKITDGNFVDGTACLYVVGCNTRDALQKRNIRAFSAAEICMLRLTNIAHDCQFIHKISHKKQYIIVMAQTGLFLALYPFDRPINDVLSFN